MKLLGQDLILGFNGKRMAANRTCTLTTNMDFVEVCAPKGSGRNKQYKPTLFGWELSADNLFTLPEDKDALIDAQARGEKFEVSFFDTTLGIARTGEVYLFRLQFEGSVGSLAKFSVQFQPTGELKRIQAEEVDIDPSYVVQQREYMLDESHRVVETNSNEIWLSWVHVNSMAKLQIVGRETDGVVVLYNNEPDVIADEIGAMHNLNLWSKYELKHAVLTAGHREVEWMLEPGDYYLGFNVAPSEVWLTESLPMSIK